MKTKPVWSARRLNIETRCSHTRQMCFDFFWTVFLAVQDDTFVSNALRLWTCTAWFTFRLVFAVLNRCSRCEILLGHGREYWLTFRLIWTHLVWSDPLKTDKSDEEYLEDKHIPLHSILFLLFQFRCLLRKKFQTSWSIVYHGLHFVSIKLDVERHVKKQTEENSWVLVCV